MFLFAEIVFQLSLAKRARNRYTQNMTTHFTAIGYRSCSRCGKPLEDFASCEAGVGPICRNKDNHLYSKTIRGDYSTAAALVLAFCSDGLHADIRSAFEAMREDLVNKLFSATTSSTYEACASGTVSGVDLRKFIKKIDWMLSYRMPSDQRLDLIRIVHKLGYVALAGVLAGRSSTGTSAIGFDATTGMLTLKGSFIKPGYRAMHQIQGAKLPNNRMASDKTIYVPAQFHEKFAEVVTEFWPCFNEQMNEVIGQAKAWVESNRTVPSAASVSVVAPKPYAVLTERRNDYVVSFPWIGAETYRVVGEIKDRIAPRSRSYNPGDRTWTVLKTEKAVINEILSRHYEVRVRHLSA